LEGGSKEHSLIRSGGTKSDSVVSSKEPNLRSNVDFFRWENQPATKNGEKMGAGPEGARIKKKGEGDKAQSFRASK